MCLVAARMACHSAEESQMVASIARMFRARQKPPYIRPSAGPSTRKRLDSSIIRNIGNNRRSLLDFGSRVRGQ